MNFICPIALLLLSAVYVSREWNLVARFLIPLLIVIAVMVLMEPATQLEKELYTYGIPVKARVINTHCYSATMDVRYLFEANNKDYLGELTDWDCGEIKAGEHLDMVYLSRAPEIHTLAPAPKPSSRSSDFLFASVLYFILFAINAIAKADRQQRAN